VNQYLAQFAQCHIITTNIIATTTTTRRKTGIEEGRLQVTKVALPIKTIKAVGINTRASHLSIKAGHRLKPFTPIREGRNSFVASLC
jgi:hypothetical protein